MHQHGPSCLKGPVTRTRDWWVPPTPEEGRDVGPLPAPSQPPDREKTAHPANPSDAPIRRDLVERIRREIAEGTYETPEKWEAALERFLEEEGGRQ